MAHKKAQGLPLSFIVIAAISALVLILIVAFTIGGLGGFFKQITIAGGGEELSTVQSACNTACQKLVSIGTLAEFQSSAYCTKTYSIDLNHDGKITKTTSGNPITGLPIFAGANATKTTSTPTPTPTPTVCTPGVNCETQLRCWSQSVGISCRVMTTAGQELVQDAGQNGDCGTNLVTP